MTTTTHQQRWTLSPYICGAITAAISTTSHEVPEPTKPTTHNPKCGNCK
jgi:hypothetical protein